MAGRKFAVLIGNSEFLKASGLTNLDCPLRDVEGLAAVLCSPERGGFIEPVVLKNARRQEIIEKLEEILLEQAGKDDLVLIYYSGHGEIDAKTRLYLAARTTVPTRRYSTAVPARHLWELIEDSKCKRIVLILDCCHGAAFNKALYKGSENQPLQAALQRGSGHGTYIITASSTFDQAKENPSEKYSVFTKHLIQGIESGDADRDGDGWIELDELYDYVHDQVVHDATTQQKPSRVIPRGEGRLFIARSGREPRRERAGKVHKRLLELRHQGSITFQIALEGGEIADLLHEQLDATQRQKDELLDRLLEQYIGTGEFVSKWVQLSVAPLSPSKPPGRTDEGDRKSSSPTPAEKSSNSLPAVEYIHGWPTERVQALQRRTAEALGLETVFRDTLQDGRQGPKMVVIPAGEFEMGSPSEEQGRSKDEFLHRVCIERPFFIGQYPVTFEEYDKFCEATGRDKPSDYEWGRATRPVVDISWSDATAYYEWLSEQTGERYRLLTEAEWEYACRAGSATRYCFGDDEQRLGDYAWYSKNAGGQTHPVGEKRSNDWQLYDMHGNVWEWVRDWYGDYSSELQSNPSGPESGSFRVPRGGSWDYGAGHCRSAYRNGYDPGNRGLLGFRLARDGAWPSYPFTLEPEKTVETPVETVTEGERKKGYQPYEVFQDGPDAPEMVYLPGGTFKMGDSQGKGAHYEIPVHEVTLDAFAIGRYPVTVGEFRRFVEQTGYKTEAEREDGAFVFDGKTWGRKSDASWRNPYFSQEENHPVVCISWNDAAAYGEWLSEQTGEQYSLPSEAEWEYACRASSDTAYGFGDDEQRLGDYAWYSENAGGKTHPVGEKLPNDWHLFDMHGNVWEWVRDWYERYSKEPQSNPSGPESGSDRVYRGGGWDHDADNCRSAYRNGNVPGSRRSYLGFRLARKV